MEPGLKRLGVDVARAQQSALRAFELDTQRERFLEAAAQGRAPRRASRVALALMAAALGMAALVCLGFWRSRPISFQVAGVRGHDGAWIAASPRRPVALSFSDGSAITLAPGARARVIDSYANGARVVLERGKLSVRVVHRPATRWQVAAGPFEVSVIGTRFEVAWSEERFTLHLFEGKVRVAGPNLRGGKTVESGGRVDVVLRTTAGAAVAVPGGSRVAPPAIELAGTEDVGESRPTQVRGRWTDLASSGAYEDAWHAIERVGFVRSMRGAGADQLAGLADVARLTGHAREAIDALTQLRKRFTADDRARAAAFMLGRLSFDQQALPTTAAYWFARYLDEAPDGVFATEALGRLMECQERLGDLRAAGASAQRYLRSSPQGSHRALARRMLSERDGGAEGAR